MATATGTPNSRTQASATSGSTADPRSHGFVAYLFSPSGVTAYMTALNRRPPPVPMAIVAGVTGDRREVIQKMAVR